jgi:hypothetical protein
MHSRGIHVTKQELYVPYEKSYIEQEKHVDFIETSQEKNVSLGEIEDFKITITNKSSQKKVEENSIMRETVDSTDDDLTRLVSSEERSENLGREMEEAEEEVEAQIQAQTHPQTETQVQAQALKTPEIF